MNALAILVLGGASLVLMSMSAMDVTFGMDLFGQGLGPQISGGLAIVTGIVALLLALRPCSTRKVLVISLGAALLTFRIYRLAFAPGAFSWHPGGWLICALMLGLPLAIIGAAILIRPASCSLPGGPKGEKSGPS